MADLEVSEVKDGTGSPGATRAPWATVDRRRFLTYLVAAPTLTIAARVLGIDGLFPRGADAAETGSYVISILEITPENRIVMQIECEEIGQGISSGLAMLVAEELDAKLADIDLEMAPAGFVGGSNSLKSQWSPVRSTAATARAYLVSAAAATWGLDAATLTTHDTAVWAPDGRSATYGSLSAAAAGLTAPAPGVRTAPKPYGEHAVIGQPANRLDSRDVVTGKAQYTMDVQVPGALATVVARPPTLNGTVVTVDSAAAEAMEGVVAVTAIPTGVAVSAENFYQAMKARDALDVTWAPGPMVALSDAEIRAELAALIPDTSAVAVPSADYVEGTFEFNFVSHSPMEVYEAIADVRSDAADVWVGSQAPAVAQAIVAAAIGMSPDSVTMHQVRAGGGFGSRVFPAAEVEAAQVSKAIGKPVKLMWTRQDTVRHGWTRPAARHQVRASLSQGIVWEHSIVSTDVNVPASATPAYGTNIPASTYVTNIPYAFGHTAGAAATIVLPMHNTTWRSVHAAPVATARELIVDELAAAAGEDPVAFRMSLLTSDRARAVLQKVTDPATGNWGRSMPPGCAQGVGYHEEFGSLVAALVEIDATDPEAPRVTKLVMAANVGRPVNPRSVEAQLLGAADNGIATTLQGGLHIANGAVVEGSFGDSHVGGPGFHWNRQRNAPLEHEIYVLPADGEPGGVGELGISPVAGAVANAYARATGRKPRQFPIIHFDV